jgi:FAD/FMN-containing dehydrogenase
VAAFVEMEWGTKAYELMWELKSMFDPGYVLNPGAQRGWGREGGGGAVSSRFFPA